MRTDVDFTLLLCAESSRKKDICAHPGSFEHMCMVCGQLVDDKFGVAFGYIHKVIKM